MNKHDASYRLLFSNPAIVRGLFHGIVSAPWLDLLDWNKLEPVPTDYISETSCVIYWSTKARFLKQESYLKII
ncbi:hypothetical protein H0A65_03500 [Alcaligenaceae bacterium]|nr:hypothetical protein [Alcaligenaceae bacterium]